MTLQHPPGRQAWGMLSIWLTFLCPYFSRGEKSHDLDFKGEEVTQWLNNVTYTVEAETWNLN